MLFCILFEYKVVFCLKWRSLLRSLSLYLFFILSRCRKPPPPLPGSHLRFACVILLVTNYSQKMFNFSSISFTPFLFRFFLSSLLRIWKKESNRISNVYLFKKLFLAMQFLTLWVLNTRGLCGPYGRRASSADDRCGRTNFFVRLNSVDWTLKFTVN